MSTTHLATVYGRLPMAISALREHPVVVAAWLGGSYALGTATLLSDVDIAVLARPMASRDDEWERDEELDSLEDELARLFTPVRCSMIRLFPDDDWADPRTPRLLARSVLLVRPLGRRRQATLNRFLSALYPDGVPSPETVEKAAWRSRATAVTRAVRAAVSCLDAGLSAGAMGRRAKELHRGVRHLFFGAMVAANLGHQAIKLLNLPVPRRRTGIPAAICRAGVVSVRTAEYVRLAMAMTPIWDAYWSGRGMRVGNIETIVRAAWRLKDWAWCCQAALERAAYEGRVEWRQALPLDRMLAAGAG